MTGIELIRVLWPLIILQLILGLWALIDIIKRKETKVLPKPVWVVIILFVANIGPVLYFLLGRKENSQDDS